MRPTLTNLHPLTDEQLDNVARRLGVALPVRLRTVLKEVNGAQPTPRHVPCHVYSGETDVPVYEFTRWDEPAKYVDLCKTYRDDCFVPARFLVLATADADTFFVDIEDPGLRVMYFQYVEGDYESHFGDGEMDLVNPTLEGFMDSFFDQPVPTLVRCPNPQCNSLHGWDGFTCRFCGTHVEA